MTHSGYVYVLANPSTSGIVKIGKTQGNPETRARALSSSSGVPTPFVVVYQAYFDDCHKAEQFIHSKLENFRVSNHREFFQVAIHMAVDAIIEAKNSLGWFEDISSIKDQAREEIPGSDSFVTAQEPERELYELLDMLMNYSIHSWTDYAKNIGLSIPQFNILVQLHYCGRFSISEISDHFGVSVPAASQLVEKLVHAGYLERTEDPADRRARLLPLSAKGKKLIEQGFKQRYRWLDELVVGLNAKEREKVIQALRLLTERAKQAHAHQRKHV